MAKTMHSYCHTFHELGVQAQLCWILHPESHESAIKLLLGPFLIQRLEWGRIHSFILWTEFISLWLGDMRTWL